MNSIPSGIEAYQLGREYAVMPIGIVQEHCVEIPAGPVCFVVEARSLTVGDIICNEAAQGVSDGLTHDYSVDAGGASLHVLGSSDQVEYLRFDAFDHEPHYHYIFNDTQRNTVVRLDDIAEGDPLAWTIRVVGSRLSQMLTHAHAGALADLVSLSADEITAAVKRLEVVLIEAEQRASTLRMG